MDKGGWQSSSSPVSTSPPHAKFAVAFVEQASLANKQAMSFRAQALRHTSHLVAGTQKPGGAGRTYVSRAPLLTTRLAPSVAELAVIRLFCTSITASVFRIAPPRCVHTRRWSQEAQEQQLTRAIAKEGLIISEGDGDAPELHFL